MESSRKNPGIIIGLILISAGLLFLVLQASGLASINLLWPFFVVIVGGLFFLGMLWGGKEAGALAIPGSIIVMIGLILFVQNALSAWDSWSFAWALIVVAVGIGLWIYGAYSGRDSLKESGRTVINTGLVLFVIFGLLFSFVFNYFGRSTLSYAFWGVLLGLLGTYLFLHHSWHLIQGNATWDERDLFWPVIMMGGGLILFLIGLGQLPLVELTGLLAWWPVLLIMLGVDWLIGKRWPAVGAIAATLLVIGTLLLMFDTSLVRLLTP